MPAKCEVCQLSFVDDDDVVQLESADMIHRRCWTDELDDELSGEVAKRVKFSEIHEDWKR